MKKILISLLIIAIMIPALSACAKTAVSTTGNALSANAAGNLQSAAQAATPDQEEQAQETEQEVTDSSGSLILSEVSISTGSTESEVYAGEELANKYVVPNIVKDNPFVVIDVHEINPYYEYSNFIFSLSNRTDKVNSYIGEISRDVNLVDYQFSEGTSPEKVTKPIAKKGINTLLMETSITDALYQKQQTAENLINCLEKLHP